MNLEVGKTYKTRGGWEARVLCTDGDPLEPIGALHIKADGSRCLKEHGVDGSYYGDTESDNDLVPPKRENFEVRYPDGQIYSRCGSKKVALELALGTQLQAFRFIEDGEVTE